MVFLDILERPCFQTVLKAMVSLDILERPCFQTVLEAMVFLDILERPCFQTFWGLFPEGLFFSAICRLDSSMRKITFCLLLFSAFLQQPCPLLSNDTSASANEGNLAGSFQSNQILVPVQDSFLQTSAYVRCLLSFANQKHFATYSTWK